MGVKITYFLVDWIDGSTGGSDSLADYCGFYRFQETYYGDCSDPANSSPQLDWFLIENFGEHYCPTCRCMNAIDNAGIKGYCVASHSFYLCTLLVPAATTSPVLEAIF